MKEIHTKGHRESVLGDQIPAFGSVFEYGVMFQNLNQFTRSVKDADRALSVGDLRSLCAVRPVPVALKERTLPRCACDVWDRERRIRLRGRTGRLFPSRNASLGLQMLSYPVMNTACSHPSERHHPDSGSRGLSPSGPLNVKRQPKLKRKPTGSNTRVITIPCTQPPIRHTRLIQI